MKAVCLASAMTVVLLMLVTLSFRLCPSKHRARQMLLIYFFCLAVLVGAWYITPDDLGILSRLLVTEQSWLDFAVMIFFFSAAFFGGALQLYNLCDRGFSLRIIIDMLEAPTDSVAAEYLMANYSHGRGLAWMYSKRIDDLIATRFVDQTDGSIRLTSKGEIFANLFLRAYRFLRLEPQQ
jgi:hypothetical protein